MAPYSRTVPSLSKDLGNSSNLAESSLSQARDTRGEKRARVSDSDEENTPMEIDQPQGPMARRSKRKKQRTVQESDSESMPDNEDADPDFAPDGDSNTENPSKATNLVIKEEEADPILPPQASFSAPIDVDEDEKPKMAMNLSYSGYPIPGRYLCVIVEPYPPLRPDQLPQPVAQELPEARFRAPEVVPRLRDIDKAPLNSRQGSVRLRSETPLFLPEDVDEAANEQVFTYNAKGKAKQLPPVPMFHEGLNNGSSDEDENGDTDLIAFSQSLANVRYQIDGSDSEEDYLRGDADEKARLIE
ncbi:hypothetical protein FRC17_006626 [Serendipita sp. 399]|nr:hypothetical protein FRC17_006626 [Serendipita sp. 399]